jgi:hypothetical protein
MIDLNARSLAALAVLLIGVLPLTLYCAKAQEQELAIMYITNPLTGNNTFDVYDYPINSVFTVEFYMGNITNLVAWQIRLTYNRTVVQYDSAWFPENNVFKEAVENGATPVSEVSNNVNNASEIGDLVIAMTTVYPLGTSPQYPVNVTSKDLLCEVNFMIASHAANTQLDFVSSPSSNIVIAPPYFLPSSGTCVETLNGTFSADGDPALITSSTFLPEASVLLILTCIPSTLTLILTRRRTKRRDHDR